MNEVQGAVYLLLRGSDRAWPFYVTALPPERVDDWQIWLTFLQDHSDGQRQLRYLDVNEIMAIWWSPGKPQDPKTSLAKDDLAARCLLEQPDLPRHPQTGGPMMTMAALATVMDVKERTVEGWARRSTLLARDGEFIYLTKEGREKWET